MSGEKPHWVYGRHVVEEILRSRECKILTVWLLDSERERGRAIFEAARKTRATVLWVPRGELDRVSEGGAHQGMAARIQERAGQDLSGFLDGLPEPKKSKTILVALDQIQDPQNFGAIARSAACFGAAALLYPERRSAPLSQAVLRASAGAAVRIRSFCVGNLADALRRLKDRGFWIYGAEMGGRPAWETRFNAPMVLVVGSEGSGIRPLVRSLCDELVSIPQAESGVESLNAASAAGILLYETARQAARPRTPPP